MRTPHWQFFQAGLPDSCLQTVTVHLQSVAHSYTGASNHIWTDGSVPTNFGPGGFRVFILCRVVERNSEGGRKNSCGPVSNYKAHILRSTAVLHRNWSSLALSVGVPTEFFARRYWRQMFIYDYISFRIFLETLFVHQCNLRKLQRHMVQMRKSRNPIGM